MIGLFDSGVGGLSVVREVLRQLPGLPIVYLADQGHAPYGQRPLVEIRSFAGEISRFLLAQGAEVVVVACNTASAAALHWLRREFPDTPFVGMEPAIKPAAERTRTRHVGVIATAATFQGELFASLLDRYAADVRVHTQACPDLVPLVEAGELNTLPARAALEKYLRPLVAAGIDELVLGCTHYPFLRPLLDEVVGGGVDVIDPAPAVARQTQRVLARRGRLDGDGDGPGPAGSDMTQGARCFYTTGDPLRFRSLLRQLLGLDLLIRSAAWGTDGKLRASDR